MPTGRGTANLGVLLGLALLLAACAPSQVQQLPRLAETEQSPSLVPPEYLAPGKMPQETVNLALVQEIRELLESGGMLAGSPAGLSSDLPIVLNRPVQSYLRYFSHSPKGHFKECLAHSGRYLPMMRRIFREYDLPQDLVYLALVESGFSPWARSPAAAVGLWQFIDGTARRYGLKVDAWVDERRDPEKSTRAAARYLRDLYRQFGCWYLAAAGYNAGEKRVEGVVVRHDTRDFWTMAQKGLLPRETCNYVPQFIAATLIAKNPPRYGLQVHYSPPLAYGQVKLPGNTDLLWFAEVIEVPYKHLRDLNPELNLSRTPANRQEYPLKIPLVKKKEASRVAQLCWKMGE